MASLASLKKVEGRAGSSMRVRWPAMGAAEVPVEVARSSSVHQGACAVVMGSGSRSTALRGTAAETNSVGRCAATARAVRQQRLPAQTAVGGVAMARGWHGRSNVAVGEQGQREDSIST